MNDVSLPPSFVKACNSIAATGFPFIKVELEAKLHRERGCYSICRVCNQSGTIGCTVCSRLGYLNIKKLKVVTPVECSACSGDGVVTCTECRGQGNLNRSNSSDQWCETWINQRLPKKVLNAMIFGRFYWDGSVDSEFTFTLPVVKAHYVIDVMKTFIKLNEHFGNSGVDISNAGMHISVMPTAVYPCPTGVLNKKYMTNFRTEVTKLLPALYFLATHTDTTRQLSYRKPAVSSDAKHSAIYTKNDTSIEYRIFDPCFDAPEAFFDKVEVIANTLKYYSDKKVVVKPYNLSLNNSIVKLAQIYGSLPNYEALLATIEDVKPDKTIDSLNAERLFHITKSKITAQEASKRQQLETEYNRRKANFDAQVDEWVNINLPRLLNEVAQTRGALPGGLHRYCGERGWTYLMLRDNPSIRRELVMNNLNVFSIMRVANSLDEFISADRTISAPPSWVLSPQIPVQGESETAQHYY